MKPSRKWAFLIPVGLLVLGMLLSGCGKELSGTVTEAGSTTVQPLAELLADEFMTKHPDVQVTIGWWRQQRRCHFSQERHSGHRRGIQRDKG